MSFWISVLFTDGRRNRGRKLAEFRREQNVVFAKILQREDCVLQPVFDC